MKRILLTLILFVPLFAYGQTTKQYKTIADSLRYITALPKDSQQGDALFHRITGHGLPIVPFLVHKVSDTRGVKGNYLSACDGQYTVGQAAYIALQHIIEDLPTTDLLGIYYREGDIPCLLHKELKAGREQRYGFKKALQQWYALHSDYLVPNTDSISINTTYRSTFQYPDTDEEVLIHIALREVDIHTPPVYILREYKTDLGASRSIVKRFAKELEEYKRYKDPQGVYMNEQTLGEIDEYIVQNPVGKKESWNPLALILQNRRYQKLNFITSKEIFPDISNFKSVYNIGKPAYNRDRTVAYVRVSYINAHGGGGYDLLLVKRDGQWKHLAMANALMA